MLCGTEINYMRKGCRLAKWIGMNKERRSYRRSSVHVRPRGVYCGVMDNALLIEMIWTSCRNAKWLFVK